MRFEINAMLFKDLTQGIRNKTFIGTFFGLLGLSALISFLVITSSSRSSSADGAATFMALCGVIYFYIIYLGARCRGLIARDINHKTMELLLLSGMSPEKSVIGRLLTVLYQLFFGLCCVIPFMFAAYFLGGLDFILIIAAAIAFFLMALPFFLLAIVSGTMTRYKKIKGLARLGFFLLMLFMVFYGFSMLGMGGVFRFARM